MAERLRLQLEAKQQLLRDVSHELRSPLARLQLALSLARREDSGVERPPDTHRQGGGDLIRKKQDAEQRMNASPGPGAVTARAQTGAATREGIVELPGELTLHHGGKLTGARIAWRLVGPPSGPIVCALGSTGTNRCVWTGRMARLRGIFACRRPGRSRYYGLNAAQRSQVHVGEIHDRIAIQAGRHRAGTRAGPCPAI
jgi:hypothetical protein